MVWILLLKIVLQASQTYRKGAFGSATCVLKLVLIFVCPIRNIVEFMKPSSNVTENVSSFSINISPAEIWN